MSKPISEDLVVGGFPFKRLGFDAFATYAHYFRNATPEDLTYYSSFPLMMYKKFGYRIVDGYLFVFRYVQNEIREGVDTVGLPIDEQGNRLDVDATRTFLRDFNRGREGRITRVHPALGARFGGAHEPEVPSPGSEYVYANGPLARLEGGEWGNLRKNVNRFSKRYDVEIVPNDRSMREDVDRIYETWCQTQGVKYGQVWDRTLLRNLLDNHGVMDHHLFVVVDRTNAARVGFFDAVRIGANLAVGVMRKLDPAYPNLAEYCQVSLAKHLSHLGCAYLNDGDDADGRPGLKGLKTRFHPVLTYTPVRYRFRSIERGTPATSGPAR